jgi:hypothetical protein
MSPGPLLWQRNIKITVYGEAISYKIKIADEGIITVAYNVDVAIRGEMPLGAYVVCGGYSRGGDRVFSKPVVMNDIKCNGAGVSIILADSGNDQVYHGAVIGRRPDFITESRISLPKRAINGSAHGYQRIKIVVGLHTIAISGPAGLFAGRKHDKQQCKRY